MLTWKDVLEISNQGNLKPDRRVLKSEADWKSCLTPEQFRITRQGGTERSFSHDSCRIFEPGLYSCVCCSQKLFDSSQKFDSGTGWPSFTQPVSLNAIAYFADRSHGMIRVEVRCNVCDAHLGHVFPDGPAPSGLRFCINGLALKKNEKSSEESVESESLSAKENERELATVVFGGGCFWCTEATFQRVRGVHSVVSGYCGGDLDHPTYEQVCSGQTGHAEVVQVTYDPRQVSLQDLLTIHLCTHDPTTLNRQGADHGTQYRSIIFYANDRERKIAGAAVGSIESAIGKKVVTQICPESRFFPAEDGHQDYYTRNRTARYCSLVIEPKLEHFRNHFRHLIKSPG